MSESPFCANFDISFSLFCRKSVQSWMRRFWAKIAEETTYGAYDGPSCLWRSVGGSVEKLLKEDGEVWQVWGYEDYDGPSWLWRSVLQVRREVQRSDPSTQIPRVEVFLNEDPRRTVVPMTVRHTCRRGEWREQQKKLHKYGTSESMMVRHEHDGPSRGPSTQPHFGRFPVIRILV